MSGSPSPYEAMLVRRKPDDDLEPAIFDLDFSALRGEPVTHVEATELKAMLVRSQEQLRACSIVWTPHPKAIVTASPEQIAAAEHRQARRKRDKRQRQRDAMWVKR